MDLHRMPTLPVRLQPLWFRLPAAGAAGLWRLFACLKNVLYDRGLLPCQRLPGFCLSVGNLVVGGTGKSPLIIELAGYLLSEGLRPAILTRGYGSGLRGKELMVLENGRISSSRVQGGRRMPDEARMQSLKLSGVPVIVSPRRYEAACFFLAKLKGPPPDIWLLDDGFQHRKLARDLDLVLLDSKAPYGNGCCLPLGTMREPASSLKRATALLLTRSGGRHLTAPSGAITAGPGQGLENLQKTVPVFSVPFRQLWPVDSSDGTDYSRDGVPVSLLAGIARPERVLEELEQKNIRIRHTLFLADHKSFAQACYQPRVRALSGCGHIFLTEKDFYRDESFFRSLPGKVFILPLQLSLPGELTRMLDSTLARKIDTAACN